jgi:hypothetical protein
LGEQLGQIASGIGFFVVGASEHLQIVVERIVERLAPRTPPQQIDELVARIAAVTGCAAS